MVNNGDVQIEKSSDGLVALSVSPVQLVFNRFTLTGSHSAVQCSRDRVNASALVTRARAARQFEL